MAVETSWLDILTLPRLLTLAALCVSAMLAAWLGLWGNLAALREWQTLMAAIIAPSIALLAASIAYKGAMAKVGLDREEAERRRNSEQLGLFLRLRASLKQTLQEAGELVELIRRHVRHFGPGEIPTNSLVPLETLKVFVPRELEEAWDHIHLIPPPIISNIEGLRRLLTLVDGDLKQFDSAQTWRISFLGADPDGSYIGRPDKYLELHAKRCDVILVHCEKIVEVLDRAIPVLQERFKDAHSLVSKLS
jgi:hypothetical protein